jgi:hypothetical protein
VRIDAPRSSAAPTAVTAIFPSATDWPENTLRFYIHFSGPMSRAGTKYVHLIDAAGAEVPDAILAAYADLWNPETTRLTVFFDPGRVKRGVGPNVALGRAIVAGRRYAIQIDGAWPDAEGRPLAAGFRREFSAGPAAYQAVTPSDWRLVPPAANTDHPLTVVFPAPLDRALLQRAIAVRTPDDRDVPGNVAIAPGETQWTFTPSAPWRPGRYDLVVLTLLEDVAGNKVGRAFEVLPTDESSRQPGGEADVVRLSFEVAR